MKNQSKSPPKWLENLVIWLCKPELHEEILGDLDEFYQEWRELHGDKKANWLYILNTFKFFRLYALKIPFQEPLIQQMMIIHHIKITFRNLRKNFTYSSINIGGFAIGIAACLLISLYIHDELSYDSYYKSKDRLYRLLVSYNEPGNELSGVSVPAPIKLVLDADFPEIEKTARVINFDWYNTGDNLIRPEKFTQNTFEDGFIYADPEILDVLEIPLIFGDRKTALKSPNSIVISERIAKKYFPDRNPVGELLILNNDDNLTMKIEGVMEDLPSSSHLQCDFMITLFEKEFWPGSQDNWGVNVYDIYLKLAPDTKPSFLEKKLLVIKDNHIVANMENEGNQFVEYVKEYFSFKLQPVTDIYLNTEVRDNLPRHGNIQVVWLFGVIAIIILLLATINFVNLTTAKAINRAKEVGVRKAIGSHRKVLIGQFILESTIYCMIAVIMGLCLSQVSIPLFNEIADKSLNIPFTAWWFYLILVMATLFIGVFSGIYPALYLSSFNPVEVLKGKQKLGSKKSLTQSGLVLFQFTISMVLLICTLGINRQMNFILNSDLGYDKEQVLLLYGVNSLDTKREIFKNEVRENAEVLNISFSEFLPISGTKRDARPFWQKGKSKTEEPVHGQFWQIDDEYLKTLGIELVQGRDFIKDAPSDSFSIIVNQKMANALGFDQPIGKELTVADRIYQIIGVVEDFHFESVKERSVEPLAMITGPYSTVAMIKINADNYEKNLAQIENIWKSLVTDQPFWYSFLDQEFENMYKDVKRTETVFTIFSILALVVACLGLFALSTHMVMQRSKEISVRKALGASFGQIYGLLTVNYFRIILIAFLISAPIGWYLMTEWFAEFEYKTSLKWTMFVFPGLVTFLLALISISAESVKAMLIPPAQKLKSQE